MIKLHSNTQSSNGRLSTRSSTMLVAAMVVLLAACTPTVKVATDEPITINLNVNIKHEILVKVDKDLDDLFADDELF
jgi:hypothetical protein